MKNLEVRILEMLISVRQFGGAHADVFPAGSRGAELLAAVGAAIVDLESLSSTQTSHARAAKEKTAQKNAAVNALREEMEAVSRTARVMAQASPGLQDKFRMPRKAGAQTLLLTARAFETDAEPLKAEFMRRGLAANFFESFRSRIEAVELIIDGMAQKSAARVSATAAVAEAAERGRLAVRELDAVVQNTFRGDPARLAEWESVSHVERAPRRAGAEKEEAKPEPVQV
jgi:hypothetical protein